MGWFRRVLNAFRPSPAPSLPPGPDPDKELVSHGLDVIDRRLADVARLASVGDGYHRLERAIRASGRQDR